MEQNAAQVSRVRSSPLVNAAESVRPPAGSAQQDTKLYTPTDGRPVDVEDAVDAVVLVVEGRVISVVLVVEVEDEDGGAEVVDDEDVLGGIEEEVLGGIEDDEEEEEVLGAIEDEDEVVGAIEEEVLEGSEDELEDEEAAAEVVVVAEEFDALCW